MLDTKTYLLWRTQMLNYMKAMKVDDMIKMEAPQKFNEKDELTKEFQAWEEKIIIIRSWLSGAISK